ncbi:protein of unknown function [Parasphingorhabdus marina DSM 22363]|uniref:DUF4345 domain-containing protein n=2 Tax=Parasphingorhabdus marina TaxID=394732 RepID=A0A1N6H2P5_9SPHN|nr:protein of unknown function [Parasphingorhabdus marina DSM 22363]
MAQLLPRTFAGVAGGLLMVIGAGLLFQPHNFSAANGIILGDNPSLISEIRAPGAVLMVSAIFMILGVGRERFLRPALALIMAIYGSYGLARLLSIMLDGPPSPSLVQAMILELIIASFALIFWLRSGPISLR